MLSMRLWLRERGDSSILKQVAITIYIIGTDTVVSNLSPATERVYPTMGLFGGYSLETCSCIHGMQHIVQNAIHFCSTWKHLLVMHTVRSCSSSMKKQPLFGEALHHRTLIHRNGEPRNTKRWTKVNQGIPKVLIWDRANQEISVWTCFHVPLCNVFYLPWFVSDTETLTHYVIA